MDRFLQAHGDFIDGAVSDAPIRLYGTYLADARVHNEPGEFTLGQWTLDATLPLPVSRNSFLIGGAIAGQRRFRFDDATGLADDVLHRYGLRLGFGHFVSEDLVLQGYWQPSVYSDLDGTLHGEDWKLWYARALAVWRAEEGLYWKGGLIATDAVDTGVLPAGGIAWQFAGDWRLDVLLPRDAKVVFEPADSWKLSAGFFLESNEYHVRGPVALGRPRHSVHVQEVYAFLGFEWQWTDNLSGLARVGSAVAGNYDYGYGSGLPDRDGTLEPAFFASVGLGWRF